MAIHPILLITLLIAAATPLAFGLNVGGISIAYVNVTGIVTCQVPGPVGHGAVTTPVSDAPVLLQCGQARFTLAQVLTNSLGVYEILVRTLDTLVFDAAKCEVVVQTPVVGCAVSLPTGSAQAPITVLGVVQSLILGPVLDCVASIVLRNL